MGNLRESVAISMYANLDSGPHERPVDRVGAMGKVDALGAATWHYLWADQRDAKKTIIGLLYKRSGAPRNTRLPIWVRMCEMALDELDGAKCRHCMGVGEVKTKERLIVCRQCKGAKVQYYSDKQRAIYMQLPLETWQRWSKKFSRILEILTEAERKVNLPVNIELERLTIVK